MAQSTPTHASGFHLVTVAMTGHAEKNGFNYRITQQFESRCLNVVKESRSERVGLYRNEQAGFACLALLKMVVLHRCHRTHRRNHVYREGTNTGNREEIQSMQCTI